MPLSDTLEMPPGCNLKQLGELLIEHLEAAAISAEDSHALKSLSEAVTFVALVLNGMERQPLTDKAVRRIAEQMMHFAMNREPQAVEDFTWIHKREHEHYLNGVVHYPVAEAYVDFIRKVESEDAGE